jgi:hypothetical protein
VTHARSPKILRIDCNELARNRHRFNARFWKTRKRKPDAEVVEMAVPPMGNKQHRKPGTLVKLRA